MQLSIPLKDIMLAPGKRFDPSSFSEKDVIERVKKIYGVITEVMDIAIKDGMVKIEFRDATPEKFKSAMKSLKKGIEEAGKSRFPNALKLFQEVLAVIPENIDARRNMAKVYLEPFSPAQPTSKVWKALLFIRKQRIWTGNSGMTLGVQKQSH